MTRTSFAYSLAGLQLEEPPVRLRRLALLPQRLVRGAEQELGPGRLRIQASGGLERLHRASRPVRLQPGVAERDQRRHRFRPDADRLPVLRGRRPVLPLPEQVVPARHRFSIAGSLGRNGRRNGGGRRRREHAACGAAAGAFVSSHGASFRCGVRLQAKDPDQPQRLPASPARTHGQRRRRLPAS